jgi:DNA transformation protein
LALEQLRNPGTASLRMLAAAGISSDADLRALGSVAAYLAVKRTGAHTSLNLLWALEGALTGRDWRVVARQVRTGLLLHLDDMARRTIRSFGKRTVRSPQHGIAPRQGQPEATQELVCGDHRPGARREASQWSTHNMPGPRAMSYSSTAAQVPWVASAPG